MDEELWQLFDERGEARLDAGATKSQATEQAMLHGAAHIWVWRQHSGTIEILLQRRAAGKRTWPNKLDIPAAGHIRLGETPLAAALRETHEELGLALRVDNLALFGVFRCYLAVEGTGLVENEFQWLYLMRLDTDTFELQASEVGEVFWKPLEQCRAELADPGTCADYVPHGPAYFATLFEAIERAAAMVSEQ